MQIMCYLLLRIILFVTLIKYKSVYSPQVILVDGNGVLHHRKFGMACHLGVILDVPCVGVAKNLLRVSGIDLDDNYARKVSRGRSSYLQYFYHRV